MSKLRWYRAWHNPSLLSALAEFRYKGLSPDEGQTLKRLGEFSQGTRSRAESVPEVLSEPAAPVHGGWIEVAVYKNFLNKLFYRDLSLTELTYCFYRPVQEKINLGPVQREKSAARNPLLN